LYFFRQQEINGEIILKSARSYVMQLLQESRGQPMTLVVTPNSTLYGQIKARGETPKSATCVRRLCAKLFPRKPEPPPHQV
jgi:hypothetical protein